MADVKGYAALIGNWGAKEIELWNQFNVGSTVSEAYTLEDMQFENGLKQYWFSGSDDGSSFEGRLEQIFNEGEDWGFAQSVELDCGSKMQREDFYRKLETVDASLEFVYFEQSDAGEIALCRLLAVAQNGKMAIELMDMYEYSGEIDYVYDDEIEFDAHILNEAESSDDYVNLLDDECDE